MSSIKDGQTIRSSANDGRIDSLTGLPSFAVFRQEANDLMHGVACDHAKAACDELRGRRDTFMRAYDDELRHEITWRRYVLEHFEEALEEGWIRAHCQPIIRVAPRATCSASPVPCPRPSKGCPTTPIRRWSRLPSTSSTRRSAA